MVVVAGCQRQSEENSRRGSKQQIDQYIVTWMRTASFQLQACTRVLALVTQLHTRVCRCDQVMTSGLLQQHARR